MSKIDFDWVRSQFDKAKVTVGTGEAVLELLKKWDEMDAPRGHYKDIADVFGKIIQGHALYEDPEGRWVPVVPGQVRKGDIVRVKADAFNGDAGRYHNGQVGKVVDVRYGDVIFNSLDEIEPTIEGAHYPPAALEQRIES